MVDERAAVPVPDALLALIGIVAQGFYCHGDERLRVKFTGLPAWISQPLAAMEDIEDLRASIE
jgi:hypothetical protein